MFGIIKGIVKIGLSPINGVKELIDDVAGKNGEDDQLLSILTLGTSSVIAGTAKGIKKGCDNIFEE